jgi:hypothetical protein
MGMATAQTPRRARATAPPAPASQPDGSVTAVARGGLGTAANLEDTQVYDLEDLRLPEAPVFARPTPEVRRAVPVPVGAGSTVATRQRSRRFPLTTGAIAAVVLAAIVGVAALVALAGGTSGGVASPTDAAGTVGATVAPATAAPDGGGGRGGGGGGGGKDHGGGGGNDGNGGGNGHGH